MKYWVIESMPYEGDIIREYASAREAIQDIDGNFGAGADRIAIVHSEISLEELRALADKEGEPLPLPPKQPKKLHISLGKLYAEALLAEVTSTPTILSANIGKGEETAKISFKRL